MKHSILLITILLAAIDNSSAQERPAMARYAKGYKGYEGLRIAVSPYADMKRALVMFYGINHPWDRKIFLCDMNEVQSSVNPRIEYQTLIDGQQWNLLIVSPQGTGEAFMKDGNMHIPFHMMKKHRGTLIMSTNSPSIWNKKQGQGKRSGRSNFHREGYDTAHSVDAG